MERLKRSKVAHWANKLAVESESNLTTAQLMLFNHDLKPVRISSMRRVETNHVGTC
jgi:NCS1 family nucleobase:cation symporter-1